LIYLTGSQCEFIIPGQSPKNPLISQAYNHCVQRLNKRMKLKTLSPMTLREPLLPV